MGVQVQKATIKIKLSSFKMVYIARRSHLPNPKQTDEIQRLMNKKRVAPSAVNMYLFFQVYNKSCSNWTGKEVDSVDMRVIWGGRCHRSVLKLDCVDGHITINLLKMTVQYLRVFHGIRFISQ